MLTNCPECNLQVSDKAMVCPHCGYPLQTRQKYPENRKKPLKRRRLPNGFGQISEIKGRYLRKPFRVMVTVGKTEYGRPICKLLEPEAYFETYNEAYAALVEYHRNPFASKDVTVQELWNLWSPEYLDTLTNTKAIRNAWRYCEPIKNLNINECKPSVLRNLINNASVDSKPASPSVIKNIKTILNKMFDYAVENDMLERNYARAFNIKVDMTAQKPHSSFSSDEISMLWNNKEIADLILIQCYTGLRPQELGLIKKSDVYINKMYIQTGIKTEAGKNRIIPIHKSIENIILKYYKDDSGDWLLTINKHFLSYGIYSRYFYSVMDELGISDHRPHDCRKTFVTIAKKYQLDEYAIKRIVGHAINDITEAIYTDRDYEWLYNEMQKIKVYE